MNLRKTAWLLICLTLALSMFLAACSSNNKTTTEEPKEEVEEPTETTPEPTSNEPTYGGDLIVGSIGAPTLFNPLYSTDVSSSDIEGFIYDSLVSGDTKFEPTLSMAEKIDVSEDYLTYTAYLKKGIKWHDGQDVTADDVVFTYNIPLSPDYDGERGSQFVTVESVTKIDDYTIEFKLKQPDVTFYSVGLSYGILPEHILGNVPIAELGEHEFNTKSPIGCGPFKFVEWKEGEYVKVERFDDYFNGKPYLDSISYKIVPDINALLAQLQAGDIDFMTVPGTDVATVKEWAEQGGVKIESGLALSYSFLGYNEKNPMFKDKKVRQALTHAIDRKAIVESVMNGDGDVANVPESPLSWAYNDQVPVFEYDVEKAKQLLSEAGWKDSDGDGILDKDGQKFAFTLKTNQGNKVREDITVVVQQQLKEIGIEVSPEIVEWSAFLEQITAPNWDYDAIVLGWSLGTFPDAYDIFHSSQMEQGLNFVWWSNPNADKLMEEARQTPDRDKYKELYKQIYQIIADEQPYTFLYYPNVHRAMPANLQGYEFHAKSDFYNVHKWWLKQQ